MKRLIPIIIIEFNTANRTIKFIKDFISNENEHELHFFIVDNGIEKDNFIELKKIIYNEFNQFIINKSDILVSEKRVNSVLKYTINYKEKNFNIILAKSNENYGFAIGNNIGANIAKELFTFKYIIFSNSDIQFIQFNLSNLLNKFDIDKRIGLVGPRIVGFDNKQQTPYKKLSLWKRWDLNSIVWPLNRIIKYKFFNTTEDVISINEDCFTYRILGAFMIFNFEVFTQIGKFDEGTFLYCEESIIGEKLLNRQYKTYYCNDEILLHEQGGSTKKIYSNLNKIKLMYKSEIYYFKKYRDYSNMRIYFSKILFKYYVCKKYIVLYIKNSIKRMN